MGRRKSSKKNKSSIRKGEENSGATRTPVTPQLHQEDAALWALVTKSLTPLKDDHDRLHFGPLLDEKPDFARIDKMDRKTVMVASLGGDKQTAKTQPSTHNSHIQKPAVTRSVIPELGGFTRRELRRVNKGHQPIEARLDLHGLYQPAAHMALRSFLVSAQNKELRHVLVITGKGRSNSREGQLFSEHQDEAEYGVLRRIVPLWLAEPDLRSIVTGFSEAPPRHGGEGALYVRLRRKR